MATAAAVSTAVVFTAASMVAADGMAVAVIGAAVASRAVTGVAVDGTEVVGMATDVTGAAVTMVGVGVPAFIMADPTTTIMRTTKATSAAIIGIAAIIPIATTNKATGHRPLTGPASFLGYGMSGAILPSARCCAVSRRSGLENEIPRWIGVDAMTIGMLKIAATKIVQASAA